MNLFRLAVVLIPLAACGRRRTGLQQRQCSDHDIGKSLFWFEQNDGSVPPLLLRDAEERAAQRQGHRVRGDRGGGGEAVVRGHHRRGAHAHGGRDPRPERVRLREDMAGVQ
jgi:hypothetical protein